MPTAHTSPKIHPATTEADAVIRIDAKPDLATLSKAVRSLTDQQLPFALALAATRTAQRIQKGQLSVMRKRLDNPTPTTMKSLFIKSANKKNPQARVWFKDQWQSGVPADTYMQPAVKGGERRHKRFEKALISRGLMKKTQYAVPTPALLDQYGNVKGAMVMRILSGLGAAEEFSGGGYDANATNSRRSRKKGNANRFFVSEIDGTLGIWERKKTAFGDGIRPVFVFVDGAPRYRALVPFFKIAENMVKAHYQREFETALEYAIATARK